MSKHQMCVCLLFYFYCLLSLPLPPFPLPPGRRNNSKNIWQLEAHTLLIQLLTFIYSVGQVHAARPSLSWALQRSFKKYFPGN